MLRELFKILKNTSNKIFTIHNLLIKKNGHKCKNWSTSFIKIVGYGILTNIKK